MHCISLARSCLPIGENGSVIALKGLVYEVVDLALVIDVVLGGSWGKDVIEIEVFCRMTVVNFDLLPLGVLIDARVCVPIFYLLLQEGTNTNRGFDLATH
jgi:hypothetical protein